MIKPSLSNSHKKIILSAFLAGIAFPGNQLGLLSFIAYIPFLSVLYHSTEYSKWASFKYGAYFGTYYSIFAMYWVGLSTFGGFIGMTLTIAVRFGLMSLLFKLLIRTNKYFIAVISFLIIQEYLCAYSDLDYTWHLAGYSLTDFPALCQIAEYTGVYGLSFFIYTINVLLFLAFKNKKKSSQYLKITSIAFGIFILANIAILNLYSSATVNYVKVGVLQPNIDPFVKWLSDYKKIAVKQLLEQTNNAIIEGADHIVFPETSVPYFLRYRAASSIRNRLSSISRDSNVTLVVGTLDASNNVSYNSVFHFIPDKSQFETYYKQKLVPVAEKVIYPAVMALFGDLLPGISGWGKGTEIRVFEAENNIYRFSKQANEYQLIGRDTLSFASTICIESTFPEFISEFKNKGAQWLNIITNDGWFYPHWKWFKDLAREYDFSPFFKGKGAYQHNQIAILRAIENRLSVVRSANTGISSIIDPFGKTVDSLNQYEKGYIVNYLPILPDVKTFFNRYGAWIIWLNLLFLFWVKLTCILNRIK